MVLVILAAVLLEHLAQVRVLPAGRFEVEHQVFDLQTKVIHALLQVADRLAQFLVAGLRFLGHGGELFTLGLGQGRDLAHQFTEFGMEGRFVHR